MRTGNANILAGHEVGNEYTVVGNQREYILMVNEYMVVANELREWEMSTWWWGTRLGLSTWCQEMK